VVGLSGCGIKVKVKVNIVIVDVIVDIGKEKDIEIKKTQTIGRSMSYNLMPNTLKSTRFTKNTKILS
jgi:hypothetical protein